MCSDDIKQSPVECGDCIEPKAAMPIRLGSNNTVVLESAGKIVNSATKVSTNTLFSAKNTITESSSTAEPKKTTKTTAIKAG